MVNLIGGNNPLWEQKVETVMGWAVKGLTVNQIIAKTDLDDLTVRKILRDKRTKDCVEKAQHKILVAAFKHKVPMLRDIVDLSLTAIKESLEELKDPERRREMLGRVSDIASLAKLVTDLDGLLSKELGQVTATETISHNYQETKIILQELKKKDLVFDYPVDNDES